MASQHDQCTDAARRIRPECSEREGAQECTERSNMINFDEEVARFQPSLDIDQAEESIYNNDMTDLSDVIDTIINGTSGKNDNQ